MSERFGDPPADAWTGLSPAENNQYWDRFDARFRFRASVAAEGWPAITEPTPSLTFDLTQITNGPRRGAAYDAINAEALRALVWALPDTPLIVLDWQHPGYRLLPTNLASTWRADWPVPVYADGDSFAFLTEDFTEGTFGHPWEQTLCVIGAGLGSTRARH